MNAAGFAEAKEFPLWDVRSLSRGLSNSKAGGCDFFRTVAIWNSHTEAFNDSMIQLPGHRLAKRGEGDGVLASYYFIVGGLAGERLIDCGDLKRVGSLPLLSWALH